MRHLTMSVDDHLADAFDQLVENKGYLNRSEAFRDLLRKELSAEVLQEGKASWCVATVSYLYNHHERQLSNRLVQLQHDHHELTVTSQHIHLDHDNCLETVILKGRLDAVRRCADGIISQTGVRNGHVHLVPLASAKAAYLPVAGLAVASRRKVKAGQV